MDEIAKPNAFSNAQSNTISNSLVSADVKATPHAVLQARCRERHRHLFKGLCKSCWRTLTKPSHREGLMIIKLVSLLVLALLIAWRLQKLKWLSKSKAKADLAALEPFTVIHSGKDASWHAPVFEAPVHEPFFLKPWLQAGDAPHFADPAVGESLEVIWHTTDDSKAYQVEVSAVGAPASAVPGLDPTRPLFTPSKRHINLVGVVAQVQYIARLTGLAPGQPFVYTVFADGQPVYSATAKARPAAGSKFRALLFGDMGNGSRWQKRIAYEMSKNNKHGAELILSMGDVVYQNGRFSEYLSKFFAVYQPRKEGPVDGGTLFDNTVSLSCAGNHDVGWLDPQTLVSFDDYPDMMAYYQLWSMPLNGPDLTALGKNMPPLAGASGSIKPMLDAAGARFPLMSNYSYDYGAAHFLVLDANVYMDWTDQKLRQWGRDRLASSSAWTVENCRLSPSAFHLQHQSSKRTAHALSR